jgi:hypothetical protein
MAVHCRADQGQGYSYWANQHEINVKMLTEGRLADSKWWVEDKD